MQLVSADEAPVSTSSPDSPLIPQAWCRRILTSLNQRKVSDRAAGNVEMLLSFFIELSPSPEAFVTHLERHALSSRADMADAARMLLEAWQEGQNADGSLAAPPLREVLRTLGARLDDARAHAAYLKVSTDSAHFQTIGEMTQGSLDALELRQEIAARHALRGKVAAPDPNSPVRYESRLRVIGAELEQQPPQTFELFITPRTVVVEGDRGYYRSARLDELVADLPSALQPHPPGSNGDH